MKRALVKIGEKQVSTLIGKNSSEAVMQIDLSPGAYQLEANFELESGESQCAYYVYIEKID